jgi:hypothetical protein
MHHVATVELYAMNVSMAVSMELLGKRGEET